MSWWLVFALAATAYGFKALGLVVVGDRPLPPVVARCLDLIPPAVIAAIVVHDTFATGPHSLGVDGPRVAGVGVAALLAWRKQSIAVVIVVAAATAAILRALA